MTSSVATDRVTLETDLNGCIKEYLEVKKLNDTADRFVTECQRLGFKLPDGKSKAQNSKVMSLQGEMMKNYNNGTFTEFFQLWNEHLSETIRNDMTTQKLEFKLNVYYAVYPLLKNSSGGSQSPNSMLEQGMANLKYYLETKGSIMSQTTEFLPFFALPYIPTPRTHPSIQDIFKDKWTAELTSTLEIFLTKALMSSYEPRLMEIYQAGINEQGQKLSQKQTQQQIYDSEKRAMQYNRKYQKIQADYHNLISIAADLIDALEQAVQGHPVDMEFLQMMCQRLFANQLRQSVSASVDLRRPGTAGNMLRQSIAVHKVSETASEYLQISDLDYEKIKYMMTDGEDNQRALLLQSLRWRLTKSVASERDQMLSAYIRHDLLGCAHPGIHRRGMMTLFTCHSSIVRQYTARLFNAFASLSKGRTYLSHNEELVRALVDYLKSDDADHVMRENVIGTLQKLSLRRQQQTIMIKEGVIEWLVRLLKDNDELSDYNLEYAVALTMNLCLRKDGKMRCAREPKLVLEVFADLLGHQNAEIRPYVNGALYSILGIPSIREKARAMSMEDILRCFIKDGQSDMNRQLEFIIKQLNSSDNAADDLSDDEEEDDDDEDQDSLEADLDKDEMIKPEHGQMQGDRLLISQYTVTADKKNMQMRKIQNEAPFKRPVTPGHMRPASRTVGPSPLLAAVVERPPTGGKTSSRSSNGENRSTVTRPLSGQSNRSTHSNGSRLSNNSGRRDSLSHSSNSDNGNMERPLTRSGSRPSSASGDGNSNLTPRPRSGSRTRPQQPPTTKSPDYDYAFTAKPKIPRTPDARNKTVGLSLPPQPTYSETLPSPRPNSASSEKGRRNN